MVKHSTSQHDKPQQRSVLFCSVDSSHLVHSSPARSRLASSHLISSCLSPFLRTTSSDSLARVIYPDYQTTRPTNYSLLTPGHTDTRHPHLRPLDQLIGSPIRTNNHQPTTNRSCTPRFNSSTLYNNPPKKQEPTFYKSPEKKKRPIGTLQFLLLHVFVCVCWGFSYLLWPGLVWSGLASPRRVSSPLV